MRDGKLLQMPHSCHHVETIRHPNSSYVTPKLYRTSTCGCNINTIFSKRAILTFLPSMYAAHVSLAGLDHACQSGNMAMLLTSLLFVFEISFLPKYTVSTIIIIIKSSALGYNVIGVYRWISPTFYREFACITNLSSKLCSGDILFY